MYHTTTTNKQYIATYNWFLALVKISLANEGTILACGSGHVNVEMLVEGKWCPGYLENVWYIPDIGRHLYSVRSVAEHGIGVIIKC